MHGRLLEWGDQAKPFYASYKSIMRALHVHMATFQPIASEDVDELSDNQMSVFAPGPRALHEQLFGKAS